ncbi:MAG: hypothetical protein Q9208_004168 [Pyrenodesmia sp. 3 TL-2023]
MPPDESLNRKVRLPRHHLRTFAAGLHSRHSRPPSFSSSTKRIDVVCISDTHGTQPSIPPGDLLLHAGDLTQWGTFAEIQAQLDWLSAQPHEYKVLIAGNHDLLLDVDFQLKHPLRWKQALKASSRAPEQELINELKTAEGLDWGGVVYLQDSSTTLTFGQSDGKPERTITIYGSPLTPEHGLSAFQHPKNQDVWTSTVPANTDILLTHGPPWGHLDGIKKSGCVFLAREVARTRPLMVVYGHIHVGHGTEEMVYDTVGRAFEGIQGGWAGWGSLLKMAAGVAWGHLLPQRWRIQVHETTFVNAAVVEGWEDYKVKNEAVVITI